MLYFIIRKLQVVSATSGRNLVDKIKIMRLTSEPAYNAKDFGTKLHNHCIKLAGLGAKYVPDDLVMLLACCYDTTNVASFDLAVIQIQNELDEDPTKYKWQALIIHFGRKYDSLVGNERWPPLQSGGKAAETGFPVHLKEGNTHEISALQTQIATLTQALTTAQGNGMTSTHGHETECHYCHESGHGIATCPKLAAKKAKDTASQHSGGDKPNIGPKYLQRKASLSPKLSYSTATKCHTSFVGAAADGVQAKRPIRPRSIVPGLNYLIR
jgi:hypothetical protein